MQNYGWYAVPESFKVYLKVDIDVAVERALNDSARKETENYSTKEEAKEQILYRHQEETNRWMDIYGVNRDDMSNYDLVLDTTILTPEEVCNKVIDAYNNWLEN
jgi:cytidylate kinase